MIPGAKLVFLMAVNTSVTIWFSLLAISSMDMVCLLEAKELILAMDISRWSVSLLVKSVVVVVAVGAAATELRMAKAKVVVVTDNFIVLLC